MFESNKKNIASYILSEVITIKVFYIKKDDKPNRLKTILNLIKVNNNEMILPYNLKQEKTHIIAKKINKICQKTNTTNIVLAKDLKTNENLIKRINNYNLHIFDGRWLFGYMAYETIDYIINKLNKKKSETEISILINVPTKEVLETIKILAKEYKRINIITNHIAKFKRLEEKLYNKDGIMIVVSNNKKRSLANAEIILNFDFVKENLNKYNIYDEAIIINIEGDMKISKKRFNGINVNNYEISSIRENDNFSVDKLNTYSLKDLVEAELYREDSFKNIRRDVQKGMYCIKELYGKSGVV